MVLPGRAPVRPRVISAVTGDSLLLEEEVANLVARRFRGSIRLIGAAGAGKTTALEHLAACLPGSAIHFLDCPGPDELLNVSLKGWVVFTTDRVDPDLPFTDTYRLAPWREDDWIEYLMATHKEQCRSVLTRLWPDESQGLLEGNPQLSRIAFDQLAGDDSVPSVQAALLRYADQCLPDPDSRAMARSAALDVLLGIVPDPAAAVGTHRPGDTSFVPLLRFRALQLVLAAARIVTDVREQRECDYFCRRFPRDLVRQAAAELTVHTDRQEVLVDWLAERPDYQAMVASLLHATGWPWDPRAGKPLCLDGAYLDHVSWPEFVLPRIDLQRADLSHADLRTTNLTEAVLSDADLHEADLREATLVKVEARRINLSGANLSRCDLRDAILDNANLARAALQSANLGGTSIEGASLSGASFAGADLQRALLAGAVLDEADFSGANLEGADLSKLKLRDACFTGARFAAANLSSCDMEDMELSGADFRNANLTRALLTCSSMPDAAFDNARLNGAGLAEIDWERASLRGADLRGVSFHLGSSRSGRVGSPIACEGSRTGFYTDDYTEQDFKSPEEIRKANLCYADLRGALIDGVDFYLVDLRHALFDPEQEVHLRRCGAILEDRGECRE
jgi:uncharacterized protein YjbI with pentapeptide repeats